MDSLNTVQKFSTGQALAHLRQSNHLSCSEVAKGINTTPATYLKTERGLRELSFVMALRICRFYKLDLHEFASLLSDEELGRQDLSVTKVLQARERKKAEAAKAKVIDIRNNR